MCDLDDTGAPSTLRVILSATSLSRMLSTLDRSCEEKAARLKWNWPLVDCAKRRTPPAENCCCGELRLFFRKKEKKRSHGTFCKSIISVCVRAPCELSGVVGWEKKEWRTTTFAAYLGRCSN